MSLLPLDLECSTHFPAVLANTATIQINPPWPDDSTFTFEIWVRVISLSENSCTIAFWNPEMMSVTVEDDGSGPVPFLYFCNVKVAGPAIVLGKWIHIGLRFDGSKMYLIVDGGEYGSAPGFAASLNTIYLGTGGSFDVSDVAVWSTARTTLEISSDMWMDPSATPPGLVFYGDFTVSPPVDLFGSTISFASEISLNWETPNLRTRIPDPGYAIPGLASDLNPNFTAPFSLSCWICPDWLDGAGTGVIYSNGDANSAGAWGIARDSISINTVTGNINYNWNSNMLPQVWAYLAMTWDGQCICIYEDGVLIQSISPMGYTFQGTPSGQSMLFSQMVDGIQILPFVGGIQSLVVWNVCLSQELVLASMYADASNDPACSASFICTSNPPADLSGLGGVSVGPSDLLQLSGNGIFFDQVGYGKQSAVEDPSCATIAVKSLTDPGRNVVEPWQHIVKFRPPTLTFCTGDINGQIVSFSNQHADQVKLDLQFLLSSSLESSDPQRLAALYAEVDEIFAKGRADPAFIPQTFSYERRDDLWVIIWNHADGARIVADYDANVTGECVVWWATFIFTVISGLLAMAGIPLVPERVRNIIDDYIFQGEVLTALSAVLAPGMTTSALLAVLLTMYEYGLLGKVFWAAFANRSWWAAGRLVVWMLGYVAPPPIVTPQQVLLIANSVVLIGQLTKQLIGYSGACGDDCKTGAQMLRIL